MMLAPSTAITRAKSPEAFRTISEVSSELDVPQHVLRFWESRFTQVRPVKRAGGRRYYRPEDIDLLRGIRALLYSEGFTIKGVQKILRERGLRHVAQLGRANGNGVADESLSRELRGSLRAAENTSTEGGAIDGEARHARAVIAALENAQDQFSGRAVLGEERRVRLELLLAELLHLKARLRAARPN